MVDATFHCHVLKTSAEVDAHRRVIGWAYVVRKADGTLPRDSGGITLKDGKPVAHATDGDVVDTPEALRAFTDAFYEFIGSGAAGSDDMHVDFDVAKIVGGLVVTPELTRALGVADGVLPTGALVVVDVPRTERGDALWADIVEKRRTQFSIVAAIEREPIEEA